MQVFEPVFTTDTYEPSEIYASEYPRITEHVTIAAGQQLLRGAVLGRVTSSGAYVLSAAEDGEGDPVEDGSEKPVAVLASEYIDASGGARGAIVYLSGHFLGTKLTIGTGHTLASVKDDLRPLGIFVK